MFQRQEGGRASFGTNEVGLDRDRAYTKRIIEVLYACEHIHVCKYSCPLLLSFGQLVSINLDLTRDVCTWLHRCGIVRLNDTLFP